MTLQAGRVVRIESVFDCGTNRVKVSHGTGYLLGAGLVLTARHVLAPKAWGEVSPASLEVTALAVAEGKRAPMRKAEIVWPGDFSLSTDPEPPDVAVLKLASIPDGYGAKVCLGSAELEKADGLILDVVAVGFPKFMKDLMRELKQRDNPDETAPLTAKVRPGFNAVSGDLLLQLDPAMKHGKEPLKWDGISGAALFLKGGDAIVGIVTGHVRVQEQDEEWFYQFRALRLGPLLEKNEGFFAAVAPGADIEEAGGTSEPDAAWLSSDRRVFIPPFPAGAHKFVPILATSMLIILWLVTGRHDHLLISGALIVIYGSYRTHAVPKEFEAMLHGLVKSGTLIALRDGVHSHRKLRQICFDEVQKVCIEMEQKVVKMAPWIGSFFAFLIVYLFHSAFSWPQFVSRLLLVFVEVVCGYVVGCYAARVVCYGGIGGKLRKHKLTLNVDVGQPDKVGGLGRVGDFCRYQGLTAALPALFLGTWLVLFATPFFELGCRYGNWIIPYAQALPVAITIEVYAFFSPMWFCRSRLLEEKDKLRPEEAMLSREIAKFKPDDPQYSNKTKRYEKIRGLHSWPIDPRTQWRSWVVC